MAYTHMCFNILIFQLVMQCMFLLYESAVENTWEHTHIIC